MVFVAAPTVAGTYHVKAHNTGTDRYWKYRNESERWIELTTFQDNDQFKFKITPVAGQAGRFNIEPVAEEFIQFGVSDTTDKYRQHGFARGLPVPRRGSPAVWKVATTPNQYSKLSCVDHPTNPAYVLDNAYGQSDNDWCVHFWDENSSSPFQRWVFELLGDNGQPANPGDDQPTNPSDDQPPKPIVGQPNPNTFEGKFFTYTAADAAKREWDIIVIGTGIGGGIVAGDLFDTNSRLGVNAKRVLVIEKGGLSFHSHCLNASRPAGFGEDRGQQNDTFFALFKEQFTFPGGKNDDWVGGAMYNVGGRSAAWGLFAPRIHDEILKRHFGAEGVVSALTDKWYIEAEKLMSVSLPKTNPLQQNLIERINMTSDPKLACQWQWGRIASEFGVNKNFDFAKGAYSPIDKLLEIAMSKRPKKEGGYEEHENWSMLINTEARKITWGRGPASSDIATGVVVRDASGKEHTIKLRKDAKGACGKVVLAAGSVHSPAILMRSGKANFLERNNGLHLTDHDIFAKAYTFQYANPAQRDLVGAMKLQTYVTLPTSTPGNQRVALCNISIDASSFLPRETLPNEFFRNEDYPKLIFAFITETHLNPDNTIKLDPKTEDPIVTCNRSVPFSNSNRDIVALRELTRGVKFEVAKALGISYINEENNDDTFFKCLGLGCVAHELGTIPIKGKPDSKFCLNPDLSLALNSGGASCGVYVADLSLFPHSPEVNPTLTLAALVLRLSRNELLSRTPPVPSVGSFAPEDGVPPNLVWVMNQTGEPIKIRISNYSGNPGADEREEILLPGREATRDRANGAVEAVAVYRLKYNSDTDYLPIPVLYPAHAGQLTAISETQG